MFYNFLIIFTSFNGPITEFSPQKNIPARKNGMLNEFITIVQLGFVDHL